jgi:hypothetical protein
VIVDVASVEIPVENTFNVLPTMVELDPLPRIILESEIVESDSVLREKVE